MAITVLALKALEKNPKIGKQISGESRPGQGCLVAVRTSGGVQFYFRYTRPNGKQDRIAIGPFDDDGKKGYTLAAAGEELDKLRAKLRVDPDLREALDHEQRAKEAEARRQLATEQADALAEKATFEALLNAYVAQLERNGKTSAAAVKRAFKLHIIKAHPKLAARRAIDITADDLMDVLSPLTKDGKDREAGKIRAYLRAAFAAAVKSRHDPKSIAELRSIKMTTNVARDLVTIKSNGKPRERALSVAELRHYWKRIKKLPEPWGALLRFHLLTGAQRIEQLSRVTTEHLDLDAKTVTLWDGKGRRDIPRRHTVPMIPAAEDAIAEMIVPALGDNGEKVIQRAGPYVFTASNGESGVSYSALRARVKEISRLMVKAGQTDSGKAQFTLGDLRRTVETRLAALAVSRDIRAQLQSHGLGGVQARHYDRHDYDAEMRLALVKLHDLMTQDPPKLGLNIVLFPQAAAS
jgi:hypothetical protein